MGSYLKEAHAEVERRLARLNGLENGFDLSAECRDYYGAVDILVNGALTKAEKIEPCGAMLVGFDPSHERSDQGDRYTRVSHRCGHDFKST